MELFDLLESRVNELLAQVALLREENTTLQELVADLDELAKENNALKEELEHQKLLKDQIDRRIEALLAKLHQDLPDTVDAESQPEA